MVEDEAAQARHGNLGAIPLGTLVRPRKQHQRSRPVVAPVRLNGGDFRRLILQGVEAMLIAEQQLQRPEERDHADAHAHHGAAFDGELSLQ